MSFSGEIVTIPNNAFKGFSSLETINLPNSVTSIGNNAFEGCTSLAGKLIIPENVETIGYMGFFNTSSITEIEFKSKGALKTIGAYNFLGSTSLTKLSVPEGVTIIGSNAFQNCTELKEVHLPSTLTSAYGFYSCSKIEKITVPSTVTPSGLFNDSKAKIKEVSFSGEVTTIPNNAFNGFKSLNSITLPSTITSIASNAFSGCTSLTQIKYNGSATGAPWGATSATVIP